ncbi:hypothetical protein [Cupriavidus sp. UME77]|uniref:hypothetical protein n=1 Tax=Cupriavidus sp. UME77 TaxID=1862321 RepID=UPI0016001666|nr:hypothetical protein [Cupriavidus sp. UME77]
MSLSVMNQGEGMGDGVSFAPASLVCWFAVSQWDMVFNALLLLFQCGGSQHAADITRRIKKMHAIICFGIHLGKNAQPLTFAA